MSVGSARQAIILDDDVTSVDVTMLYSYYWLVVIHTEQVFVMV